MAGTEFPVSLPGGTADMPPGPWQVSRLSSEPVRGREKRFIGQGTAPASCIHARPPNTSLTHRGSRAHTAAGTLSHRAQLPPSVPSLTSLSSEFLVLALQIAGHIFK